MNSLMLLFLSLSTSLSLYAEVWVAENSWNKNWENKYRSWVKNKLSPNIFVEGRYKGIKTDCADAVYSIRAIFAYENSLPFHFRNPNKYGRRYSQEMHEFNKYSKESDVRFKKFLNWMNSITGTYTIPGDTYSPFLDNQSVNSGTLYLQFNEHVQIIKEVETFGLPIMYSSTVPIEVRELDVEIEMSNPDKNEYYYGLAGFRNWRSNSNLFYSNAKLKKLGVSSNDQYELHKKHLKTKISFENLVTEKLSDGKSKESNEDKIKRYLKQFSRSLKKRVSVVQDGFNYHKAVNRALNSREIYLYSTELRDVRIYKSVEKINYLFSKIEEKVGRNFIKSFFGTETIEIKKGFRINLYVLFQRFKEGSVISYDPEDSIEERWGEEID